MAATVSLPGTAATGPVAVILTWGWRLAVLTGGWWLQTFAGGVILGIAPATLTLYRRMQAAFEDGDDGLRRAWSWWRRDFWDAQLRLGVPGLTVVVLAWYLQALRGTPFAVTVAVLGVAYLCWLMHMPAAVAVRGTRRPVAADWRAALVLLVRRPVPHLLAGLTAAAVIVALLVWYPGALVIALPALPALLATLAVRSAYATVV